jgi:hypothetical protein
VWFEQPVTQPGQEPKIANTAPESKWEHKSLFAKTNSYLI